MSTALTTIPVSDASLSGFDRWRYQLGHRYVRKNFHRFLRQRLGPDFCPIDPGPLPPAELILTTSAFDEQSIVHEYNADVYYLGGYGSVTSWLQILDHFSCNLRTIGAVLDLGCGTARMLRHFRCINGLRLVGADINAAMINWCKPAFPEIEFYQNTLQPALTFAADNTFDLIVASGVFTNIAIDQQKSWLEEVRRVLRPGGIFLCNVVGQSHPHWSILTAAEIAQFRRQGYLTIDRNNPRASLYTKLSGPGIDVFQSRAQIIASYGSVFNLLDYIPGGLDMLVLEKPNPNAIALHRPFPGVGVGFAR